MIFKLHCMLHCLSSFHVVFVMLVLSEERSTCQVVATVNSLHILGSVEYLNDCGRKIQPWVIEAPKGQRVNISLIQFGSPSEDMGHKMSTGMCDKLNQFGYVDEKLSRWNVSICLKSQERERGVYISEGNAVEIVRTDFSRIVIKPSILLRFQGMSIYQMNIHSFVKLRSNTLRKVSLQLRPMGL